MRRIGKLVCSLLIVIPVAAFAGCSSSGSGNGGGASGPPPEEATIVVDAVPTADAAGLYIALDQGYFAQQGLTVKIAPIFGGEFGMADLQDNHAQLVEGNYVSFIEAQLAGSYNKRPISMRIIANGSLMQPGNQAIYVMPGSRFKTVADLAAAKATIGLNTRNNIGQVLFGALFRQDGLQMQRLRQVYEAFPQMLLGLQTRRLDAAWLPEPFGSQAEQQFGAVPLADFDQGSLQNFPIGCYIGTTQWVRQHPNTVAAFLRALQQGQQIADTDRAAVETALEKNTGTSQVIASTMTINSYPLNMDVPTMQRVSDAMFEFGLMPGYQKPYRISEMIQPEPGTVW
jgi:NitT/TauT family transport system substrate-binding protein